MSIEERLDDIERRLRKLEAIEKRRQILGIIKLVLTLLLLAALVLGAIYAYNFFKDNIEPYRDIIEKYNGFSWK